MPAVRSMPLLGGPHAGLGSRPDLRRPISPISRCRKDSAIWWRSRICSPETFSAGSCPTAWSRNSVFKLCKWTSVVSASQRSSTPIKHVSSPLLTSWLRCRDRRSRSAGQAESTAKTTFWWRDFANPQIWRSVYASLQRWLGSWNQLSPLPVEVLPGKTTQLSGRQNYPWELH